jgi:NAD(P)-dependent dehydrogenase (short-subunit alcohol dehydrogenase family)
MTTAKHSIITGGGSGIGRAIALRFAARGDMVWILDRDEASAASVAKEIQAAGGAAEPVACDVADTASMERAFARPPHVDGLVCSAGIAHIGTVETTTPQDLDRLYAVNVKGVYHAMHFAVRRMIVQGGGCIVNLASVASRLGIVDRFAYSMTKGAVFAMTLSVARDYVAKGIRCNCICPARIHTPFVDGYLEKNYPPEERPQMFEKLSAYQPIGRMGKPDEVAALAAFLTSDEAGFITGSAYDLDGGVTLLR